MQWELVSVCFTLARSVPAAPQPPSPARRGYLGRNERAYLFVDGFGELQCAMELGSVCRHFVDIV